VLDIKLASEIQNVGENNDSVGCEMEFFKAVGNSRKRVAIVAVEEMKRTRSKTKIMVPSVVRPLNRCGV
jgi:hypothetical protein